MSLWLPCGLLSCLAEPITVPVQLYSLACTTAAHCSSRIAICFGTCINSSGLIMLLMLLLVLLLRFAAAGMVIATLVLLKRLGAFPTGSQAPSAVPPHVKHQQRLQQQQQQQQQHQQQQGPNDMDGVEYQQQQQELSTHASGLGAANGHAASDTAADGDAYRWVVM